MKVYIHLDLAFMSTNTVEDVNTQQNSIKAYTRQHVYFSAALDHWVAPGNFEHNTNAASNAYWLSLAI